MVSYLLNSHRGSFKCHPYELLRLFMSCRRVMKHLISTSLEDSSGAIDSTSISIVFKSPDSILWLLKSVSEIVGLPHSLFVETYSKWVQDVICPLTDHTSHIFSSISEIPMDVTNASFHTEHLLEIMAEVLKEQARNILDSLGTLHEVNFENHVRLLNCDGLAVTISCFQGFLWGLIARTDSSENMFTGNPQFSQSMLTYLTTLSDCITFYEDILNQCFNLVDATVSSCTSHSLLDVLAYKISSTESEHYSVNWPRTNQATGMGDLTFNCDYNENNSPGCKYNGSSVHGKQKVPSFDAVHKMDLLKLGTSEGSLLQRLLKGEYPKIAFTLRQLFSASAAILKLKSIFRLPKPLRSKFRHSKLAESSMHVLLETSVLILRETADMVGRLDPFSFVWLDAILTFLDVLGSSYVDHNLSETFYAQLIDIHFGAIGKCISFQGKTATLSSHETASDTKMLQSLNEPRSNDMLIIDQVKFSINAFKSRLRISFKKLVNPMKFDLMTGLQSLERALVGVRQECNMICKINAGNIDGGETSSIVAAGVDCLELVLESLAGIPRFYMMNQFSCFWFYLCTSHF